jgi:hypothetical protein
MEISAAAGLGPVVEVSAARRKLVLRDDHPSARHLSLRPQSDGFVRADEGSLLFRHASRALEDAIPRQLLSRRMESAKGLEFRWTALGPEDVRILFACLRWLAVTAGEIG